MNALLPSEPAFLTLAELAQRWKTSPLTIQRLRNSGKIRSFQFGLRNVRIPVAEVLRYEAESENSAAA